LHIYSQRCAIDDLDWAVKRELSSVCKTFTFKTCSFPERYLKLSYKTSVLNHSVGIFTYCI